MSSLRLQQEIAAAQQKFDYVESHRNAQGATWVLMALQTQQQTYTLEVTFPGYPNEAPHVVVRTPTLAPSLHRYPDNRICYMHFNRWNPGRHDLTFVIARAAKWLAKYEVYRANDGRWPGAGIDHNP